MYLNKYTLELFNMLCFVVMNLKIRLAQTFVSIINSTALILCTDVHNQVFLNLNSC